MERVWKPSVEISPNCPRCGCSNTKFCYYNNYSLTQPRYFCKGCRRYWTKGGSLRNVPVGGGCRKNRRGKSLRLSTADGGVHSKNLAYGNNVPRDPIGQYCYNGVNGGSANFLAADSTRSGSHIDLALVYANFLNPKPDCKSAGSTINSNESQIPELGIHDRNFDHPSLELISSTTLDIMNTNGASSINQLPQIIPELSTENCCNQNEQIFFSGLDSFHDHRHQNITSDSHHDDQQCAGDFVLPPLPGQEFLWSSTSHMMVSTQTIQPTQLPSIGPLADDHIQHDNLLTGNWSPFDLPSDDTFPGGVHEKI